MCLYLNRSFVETADISYPSNLRLELFLKLEYDMLLTQRSLHIPTHKSLDSER